MWLRDLWVIDFSRGLIAHVCFRFFIVRFCGDDPCFRAHGFLFGLPYQAFATNQVLSLAVFSSVLALLLCCVLTVSCMLGQHLPVFCWERPESILAFHSRLSSFRSHLLHLRVYVEDERLVTRVRQFCFRGAPFRLGRIWLLLIFKRWLCRFQRWILLGGAWFFFSFFLIFLWGFFCTWRFGLRVPFRCHPFPLVRHRVCRWECCWRLRFTWVCWSLLQVFFGCCITCRGRCLRVCWECRWGLRRRLYRIFKGIGLRDVRVPRIFFDLLINFPSIWIKIITF